MAKMHASNRDVDQVHDVFVHRGRTSDGVCLPLAAEGEVTASPASLEAFAEHAPEDADEHGGGRCQQKDNDQHGRDRFCGNSHPSVPSLRRPECVLVHYLLSY